MMFYSKSTGGFYDRSIHADNIPADAVEIADERHAELLAGQSAGKRIVADKAGGPVLEDPLPPTPEQIAAALSAEVQQHLDSAAKAAGYDDIRSAVTYADEPAVPRFQAEGQAFRAWRSRCWEKCYAIQAAVKTGERAVPTAPELLAELPALVLP